MNDNEVKVLLWIVAFCVMVLGAIIRVYFAPNRKPEAPPLPAHRQQPAITPTVPPLPTVWGDTKEKRRNYQHISDEAREARADAEQRRRENTPRPLVETIDGVTFITRPGQIDDTTRRFMESKDL